MATTAGKVCARLVALFGQVNVDQTAMKITSRWGYSDAIVRDEYVSAWETVYLLNSPRNAQRLRASVAEVWERRDFRATAIEPTIATSAKTFRA